MAAKTKNEQMLQEAVEAGQKGDHARARKLLLKLLRSDNREPLYWLLMSTAVESREERIYCLQNVLFLDPDNSAARHDLELLGAETLPTNVPAFVPEEAEDWQTKEIAAPRIRKKKRKPKEEPWPLTWILASLGLGVIIIFLGYYAAENGMLDVLFQTTPATTASGSAVRTPTQGQSTAATQEATPTRQIVIVPSNPEDLLEATYTPTPVYIDTPHPESPEFAGALAALDEEDWPQAIEFFTGYLAANPQSPDAAYYLGMAYMGAGNLSAAQTAFNQAIANGPQFAPGYLGRARVAIALEAEQTTILTDLNTAILLDPNFVEAYLERAGFRLMRDDLVDALADVTRAETLASQSALAQYHKALVYLAQENFPAALQASLRAYDLDLTLLPNYLAKAQAEQGTGQAAASIATMQTYLTFEGEDAAGWELLGLGFQLTGQGELALDAFDYALSLDPNKPYASYYRGLRELEEGGAQSALGFLRVAVAGAPDFFEAHIALAQALIATGNPSGAFFEINSSNPLIENDEHRAAFFYWRATALEALGQTESALADWRSLLELPAAAMPAEWRQTAEERVQNP